MVLHCVTGLEDEPDLAPTLPVFSPRIISDHLHTNASLDTTQDSPPVGEYSSGEESADDELVQSGYSGKCLHVWHSNYRSAFPVPITCTSTCMFNQCTTHVLYNDKYTFCTMTTVHYARFVQ